MKRDFFSSWHYLSNHYIFSSFIRLYSADEIFQQSKLEECLDIEVQKVNPLDNRVSNQLDLNTKTEVWLEAGPYIEGKRTHDIDLDCGADTFEEAAMKLAQLVYEKYGDNHIIARKMVEKQYGMI